MTRQNGFNAQEVARAGSGSTSADAVARRVVDSRRAGVSAGRWAPAAAAQGKLRRIAGGSMALR
jgi:hypothetical protein